MSEGCIVGPLGSDGFWVLVGREDGLVDGKIEGICEGIELVGLLEGKSEEILLGMFEGAAEEFEETSNEEFKEGSYVELSVRTMVGVGVLDGTSEEIST